MTTIKAEAHHPLPTPNWVGAPAKYPWKTMAVGESFLMAGVTPASAYSMACGVGRQTGRKFAVRNTPDGLRVWRTA